MNRLFLAILLLLPLLLSCEKEGNMCVGNFPDGTIMYEVPCDQWSGKYQGEMREYDNEGNLRITRFFVDNYEEDTTRFYTPTGFVWKKIPMKNGKAEGMLSEYRTDGTLYRTLNFENGLAHGAYRVYYPDGMQVLESSMYSEGRLNGPFIRNYPDGTPALTGEYMVGYKMGKWIRYRPEGGQVCVFTLYMDKRDGGFGVFRKSGMPYITGEFLNNRLEGDVSFFSEEGAIIRKVQPDELWMMKQNDSLSVNDVLNNIPGLQIPVDGNETIYIQGDSVWIQP
ncbi:MAG: hypothetical protein R3C61_12225 [Bacteroidia bacterium]